MSANIWRCGNFQLGIERNLLSPLKPIKWECRTLTGHEVVKSGEAVSVFDAIWAATHSALMAEQPQLGRGQMLPHAVMCQLMAIVPKRAIAQELMDMATINNMMATARRETLERRAAKDRIIARIWDIEAV